MPMQLDDETLQRYYDGDLSPVEERAVRARIESDPSAQKRLDELEKLSALMQMGAEEMAAGLDSDALFADIERGIVEDQKQGAGLRVVSGGWFTRHRKTVVPLMAVAAAAAVAVLTLTPRDAGNETARMKIQKEKTRLAEVESAPVQAREQNPVQGSRIENVDFGKNTGTVFEVENAGVMTAVVWISDEEEESP
jgi:anti-sigma factor RsiW